MDRCFKFTLSLPIYIWCEFDKWIISLKTRQSFPQGIDFQNQSDHMVVLDISNNPLFSSPDNKKVLFLITPPTLKAL